MYKYQHAHWATTTGTCAYDSYTLNLPIIYTNQHEYYVSTTYLPTALYVSTLANLPRDREKNCIHCGRVVNASVYKCPGCLKDTNSKCSYKQCACQSSSPQGWMLGQGIGGPRSASSFFGLEGKNPRPWEADVILVHSRLVTPWLEHWVRKMPSFELVF